MTRASLRLKKKRLQIRGSGCSWLLPDIGRTGDVQRFGCSLGLVYPTSAAGTDTAVHADKRARTRVFTPAEGLQASSSRRLEEGGWNDGVP